MNTCNNLYILSYAYGYVDDDALIFGCLLSLDRETLWSYIISETVEHMNEHLIESEKVNADKIINYIKTDSEEKIEKWQQYIT